MRLAGCWLSVDWIRWSLLSVELEVLSVVAIFALAPRVIQNTEYCPPSISLCSFRRDELKRTSQNGHPTCEDIKINWQGCDFAMARRAESKLSLSPWMEVEVEVGFKKVPFPGRKDLRSIILT